MTRCTAGVLRGAAILADEGAGQRVGLLVVTNAGGGNCTLYGFSGLQLIGENGEALPTQAQWDRMRPTSSRFPGPTAPSAKAAGSTSVPTTHHPDNSSGVDPTNETTTLMILRMSWRLSTRLPLRMGAVVS